MAGFLAFLCSFWVCSSRNWRLLATFLQISHCRNSNVNFEWLMAWVMRDECFWVTNVHSPQLSKRTSSSRNKLDSHSMLLIDKVDNDTPKPSPQAPDSAMKCDMWFWQRRVLRFNSTSKISVGEHSLPNAEIHSLRVTTGFWIIWTLYSDIPGMIIHYNYYFINTCSI